VYENLMSWFGSVDFMPHGAAFSWAPSLLWLYAVSDALIGLSYCSIPFGIAYFMHRRAALEWNWMYALSTAFLLAGGLTHFFLIWTLWHPDFFAEAVLRAATAGISSVAAIALYPMIPKILNLLSADRLRTVVRQLEHEVAERKLAEASIAALNDTLEQRVQARTRQLLDINRRMKEEIESRKRTEQELSAEKQRAQITLASIGDAVIATDVEGAVTYLNPVAERMTGWSSREADGLPVEQVFRIVSESEGRPLPVAVKTVLATGRPHRRFGAMQAALINRAGGRCPIEESAAPLVDHEGAMSGAVLVFHDVSEARKLANEMAHQATHDGLTGLPNRSLLNDRLDKALALAAREKSKLALMFLDIDHFKNVNDTLGHDVGDELLKNIARELQQVVRNSDTVSRQGGDEFIVLLQGVHDKLAPAEVARKLIERVSAVRRVGPHEVHVSGSIGIAVFPEDGGSAEALTKNADSAMYHAKSLGRNNFQFFTRAMTEVVAERVRMEHSLRRAIERQEFVLHYQPKIDLQDGHIIGAEALVRWNHPDMGLISPARFISVAEQSGLIRPIGSWVLREACRQNRAWQQAGMPSIRMAVNLSPLQLHQEGFLDDVIGVLREMDLDHRYLEFEVTESVALHGEEKAVSWLETLKEMGVRLSIDDFGTGYSSLSYLKRLPIDTIKIDKSFIRDITTDPDDAAIITAIIRMAHSLRLNVIAEGVETADQLDFLRLKHCNQVQGHFFSEPVPADAFEDLLMAQADG